GIPMLLFALTSWASFADPFNGTNSLLLNEVNVNPQGGNDAPCEFVEIKGTPDALLTNVYFVVIEGEHDHNRGEVKFSIDLTGIRIGSNGLAVVVAEGTPYSIP